MEFSLTLDMDNEAFSGAPGLELARILRKLAARVEELDHRVDGGKVLDVNGNSVGKWEAR